MWSNPFRCNNITYYLFLLWNISRGNFARYIEALGENAGFPGDVRVAHDRVVHSFVLLCRDSLLPEQDADGYAKEIGNDGKQGDVGVSHAALPFGHRLGRDPDPIGQIGLCPPTLLAEGCDDITELVQVIHVCFSPFCAISIP